MENTNYYEHSKKEATKKRNLKKKRKKGLFQGHT